MEKDIDVEELPYLTLINEITKSFQNLILVAPMTTKDLIIDFATRYFETLSSLSTDIDEETKDYIVGNLLLLISMSLFSAHPIHEEIATKVFEKCYEYISISFSEGIINETTMDALL